MNYYQVPYMSVLIRCYELGLPGTESVSEELLNPNRDNIRARFTALWLDDSILNATKKDDYVLLEALVNQFGQEYIQDEYINERTFQKVLQNMRTLYSEIKGE